MDDGSGIDEPGGAATGTSAGTSDGTSDGEAGPDTGGESPWQADNVESELVAQLTTRIEQLAFTDLDAEAVTNLLVDTVARWGRSNGWRVYRRAPSVVRLPPPYEHRHSCVDVAMAKPAGRPIVVEVDRSERRRTLDKLLAEAGAGRIAIWVRWGRGGFVDPPPPVHLVACPVIARRGVSGTGRSYSHPRQTQLQPPAHTFDPGTGSEQPPLLPETP